MISAAGLDVTTRAGRGTPTTERRYRESTTTAPVRQRRSIEGRDVMPTNLGALTEDLATLYWQENGADEEIDPELQAQVVAAIRKLDDGDWWTIVTELWPYSDMGMPQMAALDCVLSWIQESPMLNPARP